jgi:23S rRNA U2552 (ribose-2'-O)-methylase RlmE/FtsJ
MDNEIEIEIENENKNYNSYLLAVKVIEPKNNIFEKTTNLIDLSSNIDYPKFCYGFQHFLHANKIYMDKTDRFVGKKKIYLVMNKFEEIVNEYDDNINDAAIKFFSKISTLNYLSRDVLKLWEIYLRFDIINTKLDNFVSIHLADGPGSFFQSTVYFRDKYCASKRDKYFVIPIDVADPYIENISIDSKISDLYKNEKPQRLTIMKKYDDINEKADLITANGGFDYFDVKIKENNIQEQYIFKLIFLEVLSAFKNQKQGGTFICRFYETFTKSSLKIITILTKLYDTVYFTKPLISRPFNSEKYAVCIGFKYDEKQKDYKNILEQLEKIQKEINKIDKSNKINKIVNLFTEYEFDIEFITSMININTIVANNQLESINKIARFIDNEIYSGDTYQDNRLEQIKATQFWIKSFLINDLTHNKSHLDTDIVAAAEKENINNFQTSIRQVLTPA